MKKKEKPITITVNHWRTFLTGFRLGRLFGFTIKIERKKTKPKDKFLKEE